MKKFCLYIACLTTIILLAACGGGDGDETRSNTGGGGNSGGGSSSRPMTYTQSVTVPASKGEQVLTLSNLSSAVSTVSSSPDWMVISPQFYSSGAPTLKLEFEENSVMSTRECNVTVTASSGDKVVLTITQQAADKSAIDDLHNEQTDQPAYSPSR